MITDNDTSDEPDVWQLFEETDGQSKRKFIKTDMTFLHQETDRHTDNL